MQPHNSDYHSLSKQEIQLIRTKLTAWYNTNRRKLPWRGDKPPYGNESITHNNLVEPPHKKRKLSTSTSTHKQKQTQLSSYFKFQKKPISTSNSDSKSKPTQSKHEQITESMLNITAYNIWISEIMLQQTKVETVINYYIKWMKTFPTINKLSSATLDDVNTLWAGLGYYRRAKFLHEGSKQIINQFNGTLPSDIKQLKSIKGIGDYTAGAISSIAYNKCNPAVDGNLVRVISRLRAIACSASPPLKIHWSLASDLVKNSNNPGILNQALMELGACVCIPKSAKCGLCPISEHCKAYYEVKNRKRLMDNEIKDDDECKICCDLPIEDIEDLTVNMYPMKKIKTKVRTQVIVSGIVMIGNNVLMIKRPNKGLLADQWEYPNVILFESKIENAKKKKVFDKDIMYERIVERLNGLYCEDRKRDIVSGMIAKYEYIGESLHIFSHIKQTCHVFRIYLNENMINVNKELVYDGEYKWYLVEDMNKKALTMCVKKQWMIHVNFDKSLKSKLKIKVSGKKRKRQALD
eukprot:236941_1